MQSFMMSAEIREGNMAETILIVEDDTDINNLIKGILKVNKNTIEKSLPIVAFLL